MQEAITKTLCCLIDSIYSDRMTACEVIEDFLQKSELTLREEYQEQLVNHLKKYLL